MFWIWMAVASAQSRTGLDLDPNYRIYVAAVDNLGEMGTASGYPYEPQLGPGMCGFITLPTTLGAFNAGRLCAQYAQNVAFDWDETLVLDSPAIDASNTLGWTISYHQAVAGPVAQQGYLAAFKASNPGVVYKKGPFTILDRAMPTTDDLIEADLITIVPATHPALELFGFELYQGGDHVGWMIREVRNLTTGKEYVDHWALRLEFNSVDATSGALQVVPDAIDWDDLPQFFDAIIADAALDAANPLVSYQRAQYKYKNL